MKWKPGATQKVNGIEEPRTGMVREAERAITCQ